MNFGDPVYTISGKAVGLVAEIAAALERYKIAMEGPEGLRLRKLNHIRTLRGTTAIEGNTLTEEEITAILAGKRVAGTKREIDEVRGAHRAYGEEAKLNPLSSRDLLRAHGLMTAGLVENPGKWRKCNVGVFNAKGEAMHHAPPWDHVPFLMRDLFAWLKRTKDHPLIVSCVFHCAFETIHPFPDGNGRMGRLWQTAILGKWNPLFYAAPVENIVFSHQRQYYRALHAAQQTNDVGVFVDFMLEMILRTIKAKGEAKGGKKKVRVAYEEYVRYGRRTLSGTSPALAEVRRRIEQAARYERARVLILGPSGTGKETVAQQIHFKSSRKSGHFVAFNCASVNPNLLEDRFFGHEKGSFTGADKQTKGLFELADHGTLFLDEIGEMPLEAQAILLRALEEGKIVRVGGTAEIDVDVRLVVATNRNLPQLVHAGKFRADLYQRISTLVIEMPPLAARKEDIREIADSWWLDMCWVHLTDAQLDALCDYSYPGNVRELLNILDRARALEESDFAKLIEEHKRINRDLWEQPLADVVPMTPVGGDLRAPREHSDDTPMAAPVGSAVPSRPPYPDNLNAAMRQHVKSVFDKYNHNLTVTKTALGISVNTLKKYLA